MALLRLTTPNLAKLAPALKATRQTASNYRRIQGFMATFRFDFASLLVGLLPQQGGYLIVIDRTEWHLGKRPINVLMIGIAYQGIVFPILWQVLGKEGTSSADKGTALLRAPEEALAIYRRRWEIEMIFAALKSRGFDLEATDLRHPERVAKVTGC